MRIGVVPDGPLERLAMALGRVPYPLVVVAWGMGGSGCVITGVKLGVFDALASGEMTGAEVAQVTGCAIQTAWRPCSIR